MSRDMEVQQFEVREGDPDEIVEVVIRKGNDVRRIEAHTVFLVAASRGHDRTWNILSGQTELVGRLFATAVKIAHMTDELSNALTVALVRDYVATARAIGSAFIQHSKWEEKHSGETQGDPRPPTRGQDGPGTGGPGAGS